MAESTPILRDILLDALRTLPGTREFHIHVLQSSPRRNTSLFQFAKPRPRTYVQDVLVLLSEQANPDAPRVLVTAIEGNLYHIPSTSSAILYMCKVDSTGQTNGTSPTRALVRAFLNYYANPTTRPVNTRHLWIQLFARAQGQYLFPNSAQFDRKRPLSDVKLCAWWKRVLSQVAIDVADSTTTTTKLSSSSASAVTPNSTASSLTTTTTVEAYYVLPGYSQLEAEYSLKVVSSNVSWEYGHPYTLHRTCFPCPLDTQYRSIGHYIPYFDDDPKSRFLDEIAYTTGGEVKSPIRKRARTATSADDAKNRDSSTTTNIVDSSKNNGKEKEKDDRPLGELGKVTPDEFWERMSFRQECVAGAITGFFTLVVSTKKQEKEKKENEIQEGEGDEGQSKTQLEHVMGGGSSPLEPRLGQVSSQINKRILTALTTGVEFSSTERAIKATETLESAIKKLCEGITSLPNTSHSQTSERSTTPEPRERAKLSLLVPPSTPPRRRNEEKQALPDVTPNPFPEPVASLETYQSYIYGTVAVSNSVADATPQGGDKGNDQQSSVPVVTVLTARKKKKRVE